MISRDTQRQEEYRTIQFCTSKRAKQGFKDEASWRSNCDRLKLYQILTSFVDEILAGKTIACATFILPIRESTRTAVFNQDRWTVSSDAAALACSLPRCRTL